MDYIKNLKNNIVVNRKHLGWTQEMLAEKLGITFQAVSKWENGLSSPDISMLPVLSQLFGISMDELFGMSSPHALTSEPLEISWPDDNTIRIAVFSGKKLLTATEEQEKITVKLENEPENVVCYCNLECEIINGAASANGNLSCGNYIGENA